MTTLKLTLLALAGTLAARAWLQPMSVARTGWKNTAAIKGGKPAITIKPHGGFVAVFK
jgi:hypothetical protein